MSIKILHVYIVEKYMSRKTIELNMYDLMANEFMHLGENLKRIREGLGITQKELAERCGISDQQLSRLEGGSQRNPGIQTVVAICTALGVSIGELVHGEDEPEKTRYMLQAIDRLPKEKQRIIRELIAAFVAQSTADRIRS